MKNFLKIKPENNPENLNILNVFWKKPKSMAIIVFSAILYLLTFTIFLEKANVFAVGISSIVQLIVQLNSNFKNYFSLILFIINLPLLFIFRAKVRVRFIYFTFWWLVFQIIFTFIFDFSGIKNFLVKNISIYDIAPGKPWNTENSSATWPILLYTFIGSFLSAFSVSIAWKNGGSSAGTDIFVYFFSTKKKESVGKISLIFGISFAIFSIIAKSVNTYINLGKINVAQITVSTFGTFCYVFITSHIINYIYPRYKKMQVKIYSKKTAEICAYLKSINYWHGYNLIAYKSGYTGKQEIYIETTVLFLELKEVTKLIKKVDPLAFLSVEENFAVLGKFNSFKVE